jgi:hypothetical protein
LAKKRRTAAQAANNWHTRIGQSAGAYSSGVNSATNWAENATSAAATALRDNNLRQAISDGSINKGILKAGDAKWKANTIAKGVPAWQTAAGSAAAQTAYQNAMTTIEGDYSSADAAMNAAGDGSTTANRIQRAAAWATAMHQAKINRGGKA